eukprot:scaffold32304_cov80-Phaeocystis_antarctica.AAC.2
MPLGSGGAHATYLAYVLILVLAFVPQPGSYSYFSYAPSSCMVIGVSSTFLDMCAEKAEKAYTV